MHFSVLFGAKILTNHVPSASYDSKYSCIYFLMMILFWYTLTISIFYLR